MSRAAADNSASSMVNHPLTVKCLQKYTPIMSTPAKCILILIFAAALVGCDIGLNAGRDTNIDVDVDTADNEDPNSDTHWYTKNPNALTFYISTAAELAELAQIVNGTHTTIRPLSDFYGKTITLTADIDLAAYGEGYNDDKGWIPIGRFSTERSFRGAFNGGRHKITGLYINNGQQYTGLFGYVNGGRVENLGIIEADITGAGNTGGIIGGVANGGIVRYCYATGSITGTGNSVGGIAGSVVNGGALSNCYSTGDVTGNYYVGGIAGNIENGTVSNCYATGAVIGNMRTGGVTGYHNSSTVQNCAALNPTVKGGGSLTGRVSGEGGSFINNCAFAGMGADGGAAFPSGSGATHINGADITKEAIAADGAIGGRFTTVNGWTVQNGRLPGLFGETVELPEHLSTAS